MKQTEIGFIPDDWKALKFEDVLTGFSSGATPYRGNPEYYKGNIRWITSGELNYNIINNTQEKITSDAVKKTNLRIIPKGTFLMAITGLEAEGTRGRCGIVGQNSTTNQSCMALFTKKDELLTEYLFHFYKMYGNFLALNYCQGTKQQSYTGKIVKILPINLPPKIEEQKIIAQALSDVDSLITSIEKTISKKRDIKTATMQQLLTGKKRLSGFGEGKGYKQTEIGFIPEDWEVKSFGENLNIISGLGFKKSEYINYGIKLLRIDNVSYGEIIWDSIAFLPESYIEKHSNLVLKKDDILLALNRPITNYKLKLAVIKNKDLPAILYQRVGKIVFLNNYYDKKFAYYLLSKFVKIFVEENSVGTDQPFISTTNLKKYLIPYLPKIEEQKAIAQILTDMDDEIKTLENKLEKTKLIKQGMMQELLTGKTRLL